MSTSNAAAPSSPLVKAIETILEQRAKQTEVLARRARSLIESSRRRRTWVETKRELLGHLE